MATLLLIVVYIAFIGLGVPDSLFGTAWPVMYREFSIPTSYASFYSILCFTGTVSSSLLSARLINRFGTGKVTAVSTALTAIAMLLISTCGNVWSVLALSVLLGLGAGAVDSGLNNYVALHYTASQMNYLHCFYGVGVAISPFVMSLFLSGESGWRGGYKGAFVIQLVITVICFAAFPLWKRAHSDVSAPGEPHTDSKTVPLFVLLKNPEIRAVCLMFFSSLLLEFVCGTWSATYLVDHKGFNPATAAELVVVYYAGMISGRFLSGILSSRLSGWRIIKIGCRFLALGLILLALPFGSFVSALGLFFIALGNGPVYPNLAHLGPISFGRDISQSVMGAQLAAANAGAMVGSPIFGIIVKYLGVGFLPIYLALAFVAICYALLVPLRKLAK